MFYAHSTDREDRADWQTLSDHLLRVGELSAQRAERFGAASLGRLLGRLHDLGKYSTEFQRRLAGSQLRVDHSTAGARLAIEDYGPLGYLLAYAVAGHHAGLANGRDSGTRSALATRLAAGIPDLDPVWREEIELDKSLIQPEGFQVSPRHQWFQTAFLIRMLFSCLVDADFRDTAAFYECTGDPPDGPDVQNLTRALDQYLRRFDADSPLNRERAHILSYVQAQSAKEPGAFSLTVPTGGGKTLASLAFALDHAAQHGMDRVIYVIPFTSIVEQNAAVFREALGEYGDTAVLEHHSAFDANNEVEAASRDKLSRAKEDWSASVVVTTAVQFFESLFAARTSACRKLHNIARSVIVLDEAQTLPQALLRPCVRAMDELARNYRSSVVLCTATQPALEESDDSDRSFPGGLRNVRELAPEPHRLHRVLRRTHIRSLGTLDDDELKAELISTKQALCIVNNRLHARALYQSIADHSGAFHLTTAMCAVHRRTVLAAVRDRLARGESCRLVATSLIEAGVDVDFPRVLRAEAGLDSIIQAAGRCNREGRQPAEASEVGVFAIANDDWKPPAALAQHPQASREIFRAYGDPASLAAVEAYFRLLYWQRGEHALDAPDLLGMLERGGLDGLPFETVAERFRMIDNGQSPIIVRWDNGAKKALRDLEYAASVGSIARWLQPYTVQVPTRGFERLRAVGAIAPIAPERFGEQFMQLVNEDLYDDRVGLDWQDPEFRRAASNIW